MNDPYLQQTTRKKRDAIRFMELDANTCQMCGAYGADKRNLFVDCGYDISESVPEAINIGLAGIESHQRGWYLRLCKHCRGTFLKHMQDWRTECLGRRRISKDHDGYETFDEE